MTGKLTLHYSPVLRWDYIALSLKLLLKEEKKNLLQNAHSQDVNGNNWDVYRGQTWL